MKKSRKKISVCPNCNFNLHIDFNFCPNCGQENHTHKVPVKNFVVDFLASSFNFDTKIINTLTDLFKKPGLIIQNFNLNKRVRYVTPMKFYIFISFIFFLLLFKLVGIDEDKSNLNFNFEFIDNKVDNKQIEYIKNKPSISVAEIDSILNVSGVSSKWYNRNMFRNYLKLKSGIISTGDFVRKIINTFSTLLFVLMPLFAFYIFIFYRKQKQFYAEHLVCSIYLHSVVFLVLILVLLLLQFEVISGLIVLLGLLVIMVYTLMAFRVVYAQSFVITFFKVNIIGIMYIITLLIGLILSMFLSLI